MTISPNNICLNWYHTTDKSSIFTPFIVAHKLLFCLLEQERYIHV